MARFTDRKVELATLRNRFAELKKGELIILQGRRRVGKTELVRRFLDPVPQNQRLYLYLDEGTPQDMLRSMVEDISTAWPAERPAFSSWDDFFSYLGSKATESGKLVVAIDEFQRLNADPRAFSRLQRAWDTQLKDKPIMLVLLGSAVSIIYKIALSGRSPLFGRATELMTLEPFDYQAFREALAETNLSEEMKVRLYATFGGLPRYLEFAEKADKAEYLDVVEENVLRKNGLLREEPSTILMMELKDTGRYNSILAAIAKGHRALKDISDQTGIASPVLQYYLGQLSRALGLVEKRTPVCGNRMAPQYVLRDNFFKFWYNFVAKNSTALEINNYKLVRDRISAEIEGMTGFAFEEVIRELIAKHNNGKLGEMPINVAQLGGWWDRKGNEIDICGQSKGALLLGEVRWRAKPVDYADAAKFFEKRFLIDCTNEQRRNIVLFVVSKSGFEPKAHAYLKEHGIHCYDLKDIAKAYDALPKK